MLKVKRKIFYPSIIFIIAFIVCTLVMFGTGRYSLLLVLTCIVFAWGIIYILKDIYNNICLASFLICFFTFLLGGQVFNSIMQVYGYNFPKDIEIHTNIVLLISLIGILSGYVVADGKKGLTESKQHKIDYNGSYYKNVRKISKYFFLGTYLIWMITLLDNVFFVLQRGYTSYYLSYSSRVPAILREIGYMSPVVLFIYLATMPPKKEAKFPLILYGGYLLLSLGTGRRIYFMTGVLLIFSYMMMRNVVASEEKPWVSKRNLIKICVAIPILLIVMYFFEYVRSEHYVGSAEQYSPLIGFFVRQGTSINVIKYAKLFENRLNSEAYYSLYNLLRWLQNSWLNVLLDLDLNFEFGRQSIATAVSGTYLADFVSYNANAKNYAMGIGYGSCYIAELYVDFGYIGVFIGNFLYGTILCKLLKFAMNRGNIWLSAIGLLMLEEIFKSPRATFDSFLGSLLYFNAWGPIVLVYLFTNFYQKSKNNVGYKDKLEKYRRNNM